MSFKQQVPNEAAFRHKLLEGWGNFYLELKQALLPLEASYTKAKQQLALFKGLLFGGIIVIACIQVLPTILIAITTPEAAAASAFVMFFAGGVCAVYGGYHLFMFDRTPIDQFNYEVNRLVFRKIFSMFDLEVSLIGKALVSPAWFKGRHRIKATEKTRYQEMERSMTYGKQVLDLLDHSELITEPRNQVVVGDMFSTKISNRNLFIAELNVKHETGSGKNRRTKKIFHGYFCSFDLPRSLAGKTFVSTEGDKRGFGHLNFWRSKTADGVEETLLEWNEFEDMLHVASNNPSEARYILPPDFMQDLYDWWKEKKQNIRLAFVANRMYVLFPDQNIKIQDTVGNSSAAEVQLYAESIGVPLMHVLHLVEDVDRQVA